MLAFGSGDLYLFCRDCGAAWGMLVTALGNVKHLAPELSNKGAGAGLSGSLRREVPTPVYIEGPNTQDGYHSMGDYGPFCVPDLSARLAQEKAKSPARVLLWFAEWEAAQKFIAAVRR